MRWSICLKRRRTNHELQREISEAFEEYRRGMPDVYEYRHQEPHGIAIELIDLAIRLLDYAGANDYDVDGEPSCVDEYTEDFVVMINDLHYTVYVLANSGYEPITVRGCLDLMSCYCASKGLDFETLLRLKHEYNKTRAYRHGGKRC